jgi:hypothetical protein
MSGFESWIHVLPVEIRRLVINHLNFTDTYSEHYNNSLLDGISLALAYTNLLDWPHLISPKLAYLPNFNKLQLVRLLQLCDTATFLSKHHYILESPRGATLQLDMLEDRSIGEKEPELTYWVSSLYRRVLQFCPNISKLQLLSSTSYVYSSTHEQQLYEIFDPVSRNLDELQLALSVANTQVFEMLRNCLKNSKIQKLTLLGGMRSECLILLKEQKHVKSFMSDQVNGYALEQLVHYWPYLEDLDISGLQLYTSAHHICKALYQCSSQLKRLRLAGVSDTYFNSCYFWLSDEDDKDSFVQHTRDSYEAVLSYFTSLSNLSISMLPICGDRILCTRNLQIE